MERIAIIDHDNHRLLIEDVDEEILNDKYGGEEEAYIKDNYELGNFSWDFITGIEYIPEGSEDPMELDPKDII